MSASSDSAVDGALAGKGAPSARASELRRLRAMCESHRRWRSEHEVKFDALSAKHSDALIQLAAARADLAQKETEQTADAAKVMATSMHSSVRGDKTAYSQQCDHFARTSMAAADGVQTEHRTAAIITDVRDKVSAEQARAAQAVLECHVLALQRELRTAESEQESMYTYIRFRRAHAMMRYQVGTDQHLDVW